MIEPVYFFRKKLLHASYITAMLMLTFSSDSHGQKVIPAPYVGGLDATKQIVAGGAAGAESRALYLVTCRMHLSAEISNVKATIAGEDLPVKIIYKNTEYDKVQIVKGDTFFFRVTKRLSAPATGPHAEKQKPASAPSANKKAQTSTIRFTINHNKNELLQIRSFSEKADRGRQLEL